jgi:hypothetical protein
MELVHFVKNEEAELAKKMESKLASLDRRAGVLFVGVSVQPSTPESPTIYQVWIGCSRDIDPRMIPTLVEVALYEEMAAGHVIRTEAKMGRTCS